MLAVSLFIALFVLLAFGVFFVGISGGMGGARQRLHSQASGGRGAMNLALVVVYLGFGGAIPLLLLTGNHSRASAAVGGIKLTTNEKVGREIFGEHCGVCHTLQASNSVGKVGPNLDGLKPPAELVLHTIENGCVQNPSSQSDPQACLGYGTMPANVVQGKDASDVAAFVSKVAGHE
jgi:mono/diheme cytochrome c family protein